MGVDLGSNDEPQGDVPEVQAYDEEQPAAQDVTPPVEGEAPVTGVAPEAGETNFSNLEAQPAEGTVAPVEGFAVTPDEGPEDREPQTVEEVAIHVLNGKYGVGQERRQRLADEGWDHVEVHDAMLDLLNERSARH